MIFSLLNRNIIIRVRSLSFNNFLFNAELFSIIFDHKLLQSEINNFYEYLHFHSNRVIPLILLLNLTSTESSIDTACLYVVIWFSFLMTTYGYVKSANNIYKYIDISHTWQILDNGIVKEISKIRLLIYCKIKFQKFRLCDENLSRER